MCFDPTFATLRMGHPAAMPAGSGVMNCFVASSLT